MRDSTIHRKMAIKIADAIFWHLNLGRFRGVKTRWNLAEITRTDLTRYGYDKITAERPTTIATLVLNNDVGKCKQLTRIVRAYYHDVVVLEVLLLGKEFNWGANPYLSWKIGSVRYRPVERKKGRGVLYHWEVEEYSTALGGRMLRYEIKPGVNIANHVITQFGDWLALDPKHYQELNPIDHRADIPFPEAPAWQ